MKKFIILGGLGNGSVIAAAISAANRRNRKEWIFAGYLNDRIPIGNKIEGFPVLGKLADAQKFVGENYYFINTIYRIDGQKERIALFENLNIPESQLATFIHPTAYIAQNVEIGKGCVIMPNVAVSSGVKIGRCCLVMVGTTVGHNSIIGDYCHLAAQSCVSSFVELGFGVHIGLNATLRENIKVGKFSAIGMGSVLLENVGAEEIWAGNPAKFIRNTK